MGQSTLAVSFVCSRNCGEPCDEKQGGSSTLSNACVLFTPLNLKVDGDPNTDDVFDVCPDVGLD